MARGRISLGGLMAVVAAVSVAMASLRSVPEFWAGVVVLATLAILAVAVLGVVYRDGERRASWLGFALLGWGYMVLTSGSWWDRRVDRPEPATTSLLDLVYEYARPDAAASFPSALFSRVLTRNARPKDQFILKKLEEPISMSFANETPLEDVLKYIKGATTGPADSGIPIYVDTVGLQSAEKTMSAPVTLDVDGVPLRITLRLLLAQLGLAYEVRDGLLTITAATNTSEPFRRIGHCYLALIIGMLGSVAARRFYRTRDQTDHREAPLGAPAG